MTERPTEPRLLALRLQGFKSFAERTSVEFGPGISAVVGPNGSGKSNLADALRWALGEQGRALRSRKSEDVIWAGSEKRAAQGMADVTLVLDNADGLLPVDFQVLELGRRLYRSGENDYLLNKSRIRLRDLVDLLDSANLADNAFLFIGQGMVDQALALRPEERRPLFEEVAGVRRHERRRRRAETQLIESSSNLARVEDILGELRPQARRLAAQAEQQASREATADELMTGLLLAMHARWHEAAQRLKVVVADRDRAGRDVERATQELTAAETVVADLAGSLADRASAERSRRDAYETARATATEARLRDARLASELEAIDRDRRRLTDEAAAAETARASARRTSVAPVPPPDLDLQAALATAERDLAEAMAELGALREAREVEGEQLAALRRAAASREAERELAGRHLAQTEQRLSDAETEADQASAQRQVREAEAAAAGDVVAKAVDDAREAATRLAAAIEAASYADAARVTAQEQVTSAASSVAVIRGRLDDLADRLAEEERRGIAKAARRVGGRRVDEELVVDPPLRAAVEAALAEQVRAYIVAAADIIALAGERGSVVVRDRVGRSDDARSNRFRDMVDRLGGGTLDGSIRRDGSGVVGALLARAAWLPDLAGCLAVQADMPPGWVAVPRDGSAVVTGHGVTFGSAESVLDRRADHARLATRLETLEADLAAQREVSERQAEASRQAAVAADAARAAEAEAADRRRTAEDDERRIARSLEAAVREATWQAAQTDRLRHDLTRAQEALAVLDRTKGPTAATPTDPEGPDQGSALAVWEVRTGELRDRRDRLAVEVGRQEAARREADLRRASADASTRIAEERITRIEEDVARLAERHRSLTEARDQLRLELARSVAQETAGRERLAELETAGEVDRHRLTEAEGVSTAARDRLRAVDLRLRQAEHDAIEARLGLDSLHETMVAELAGLGQLAFDRLQTTVGPVPPVQPVGPSSDGRAAAAIETSDDDPEDVAALEATFAVATERWAAEAPSGSAPSAARLGQLRRRFHELGAVNPFAVDEYTELKERLDTLEAQVTDLGTAIATTRQLIAELDDMIADRFRTTFEALEAAFARRFEQLFGGGFARLAMTDPADLGATGIEIVARPPGKKAQALAMLSGGERALTAVALLFAMLEVRPVPFCVLDEVDAALDESNIGRFADALQSLAHQTQFIVITHNRGTIEAADALYGVTVGDDSVSRIISLRLDEAQAIASRSPASSMAGSVPG